jgi:hypothetical protein
MVMDYLKFLHSWFNNDIFATRKYINRVSHNFINTIVFYVYVTTHITSRM